MTNNINNFKKELKTLLGKYNASISFDCGECSDLHGVYDEKIIANIDNNDIFLSDGYSVGSTDL